MNPEKVHQKGGSRNYPEFGPGQPDPARFLKGLLIIDIYIFILDTLDALWPRGPGGFYVRRAVPHQPIPVRSVEE